MLEDKMMPNQMEEQIKEQPAGTEPDTGRPMTPVELREKFKNPGTPEFNPPTQAEIAEKQANAERKEPVPLTGDIMFIDEYEASAERTKLAHRERCAAEEAVSDLIDRLAEVKRKAGADVDIAEVRRETIVKQVQGRLDKASENLRYAKGMELAAARRQVKMLKIFIEDAEAEQTATAQG